MAKKKVFISFDFDNDLVLKELIVGQEKLPDLPFEVVDTSLKEAAPLKGWEVKARAAVQRSDLVIVMLGERTATASGVLKEVAIAREAGVPVAPIIGNKGRTICKELNIDQAKSMVLYQSRFFEAHLPEENKHFANVVFVDAVPDDREASLLRLREAMLSRDDLTGAVFVGGMEGVEAELALFKHFHPNVRRLDGHLTLPD